ncbi:hypothetical protein ACJMK2_003315 [Sinanodonta woodiana]|uniref:EGF-like domain-containing protein n=1 Tax=Sinanodonta woodiana TaxID=1069815 RepID=A0ABD3Y134_SINWO
MSVASYAILLFFALARYKAEITTSTSNCIESGCSDDQLCRDANNEDCKDDTSLDCQCKSNYTRGLIVTCYEAYSKKAKHVYSVPIAQNGTPIPDPIWSHRFPTSVLTLRVDVDNIQHKAYVYHSKKHSIYKNPNYNYGNSTENLWTVLYKGISSGFVSLAVDWVSHNIYWTDPTFKWIMVQSLSSTDTSMFRVLIQENIYRPQALALDPTEALLFWSDIGKFTSIVVSSLSGRNRKTIVISNLLRTNGLAADHQGHRLYFADTERDTVETVTYDGTDRTILLAKSYSSLIDVAVYQDSLYVADMSKLYVVNKTNGNAFGMEIGEDVYGYAGVAVFHDEVQPVTDRCQDYGCAHICLTELDGATCICKDGYHLNEDNKTCSLISAYFHRALVFSNDSSICILDITVLADFLFDPVCVLQTTGTKYIAMDTDQRHMFIANDTAIYWTSVDNFELQLLTKLSGSISGMTWDGYDRNVYWTESDTGTIWRTSIQSKEAQVFLEGLAKPREVLILPHHRLAYWISERNGSTIESSNIDGNHQHIVLQYNDSLKWTSLSYNPYKNRLYFLGVNEDEEKTSIISCNLDGSNRASNVAMYSVLTTLEIYKGYTMVTSSEDEVTTIWFHSLDDIDYMTEGECTGAGPISVIKVFDENNRQNETGPCFILNGGCEQICIPNGMSRMCKCVFGFMLAEDGTTCISDPVNDDFMFVGDITHTSMYQIRLNDTSVQGIKAKGIKPRYDPIHDRVIWLTLFGKNVYSMYLNGTGQTYFPIKRNANLFDVDVSTGNVYFVSQKRYTRDFFISVMSPDGKHLDLRVGLLYVYGLVVSPSDGYMFYIHNSTLVRATMDGTHSEILLEGVRASGGLTVDFKTGYLYWIERSSDPEGFLIVYCKADGSNRTTLYTFETSSLNKYEPNNLAIHDDDLFITLSKQSTLMKLKLSTPKDITEFTVPGALGKIAFVSIYSSSVQKKNAFCFDHNGNCSTFCLPVPDGGVCACEAGVEFKEGSTSVCSNMYNSGLIVTGKFNYRSPSVYSLPIAEDGTPSQIIIWSYPGPNDIEFLSVDLDNTLQQAYLYDIYSKTIQKNPNYNLGPSTENQWTTLHKGLSPASLKLAVDWVSHNIYWTDPMFKWIMVQSILGNDTSMFRVLIDENLEGPYALAVDPYEALLFWSDIGTFTKIEVSSLSGRNRKTIVLSNLLHPYGLAADYEDQRLYFVDTDRHTVETVTYDGADRKIVLGKPYNSFFDITFYKDYLYVTDKALDKLFYINKTNGNEMSMNIEEDDSAYFGVAAFYPVIQPLTAHCEDYGCEQICLTELDGATCTCKDGYHLNEDNTTCSLISAYFHHALVFSNDSSICVVDIGVFSKFDFDPVCVLETTCTKYMVFDTDRRNIIIANDTAIYWTSVDNLELQLLTKPSGKISGIGWDGYSRSVYWTEEDTGKIFFTPIDCDKKQIFIEGLTKPRDILILPHQRMVYWISEKNGSTIESAKIDGSQRRVVLQAEDGTICWTSLSYDQYKKRIYFIAIPSNNTNFIISCNLDGSNRHTFLSTIGKLERLDIFKGYLLSSEKQAGGTLVASYFINDATSITYGEFSGTGPISDIKVFDENDRQNKTGPCFLFNGECEQICIPNGSSRICKCSFGFKLAGDEKTCISDPVLDDFMLIDDVTHQNIYQVNLKDQSVQGIKAKGISPAYDPVHERVIWRTNAGDTLFSMHLNGTDKKDFPVQRHVYLFDVDHSTGDIYFASEDKEAWSYISVLSLDGEQRDICEKIQLVGGLVLSPSQGYMFSLQFGRLVRSKMDCTQSVTLLSGLHSSKGLTIDSKNGYLYWIEASDKFNGYLIKYCKTDGTDYRTLFEIQPEFLKMYSLVEAAVYEDHLYITFNRQSSLLKLSITAPKEITEVPVQGGLGKIKHIKIYSSGATQIPSATNEL